MLLTPGQILASYEIAALLGKGGMGEVYRARDPKLDRDVAIKVLPDEFAQDEERLLRFQREAKPGRAGQSISMMVVDVKAPTKVEGGAVQAAQGASLSAQDLEISPPRALFELATSLRGPTELTPNGEGFLATSNQAEETGEGSDEIIVVENFFLELERKVAERNR